MHTLFLVRELLLCKTENLVFKTLGFNFPEFTLIPMLTCFSPSKGFGICPEVFQEMLILAV